MADCVSYGVLFKCLLLCFNLLLFIDCGFGVVGVGLVFCVVGIWWALFEVLSLLAVGYLYCMCLLLKFITFSDGLSSGFWVLGVRGFWVFRGEICDFPVGGFVDFLVFAAGV